MRAGGKQAELLLTEHRLDAAVRRNADAALKHVGVKRHRAVARTQPDLFVADAHFNFAVSGSPATIGGSSTWGTLSFDALSAVASRSDVS